MNKKLKIVISVIVVVAVILIGYLASTNVSKQTTTETIKIGVIAPLSGDVAFLGEGFRDAILLAKENLGKTKYNYEIIFEDDQLDPRQTATAANKLISINKVDVVVSFGSGAGNVVSPIAEKNKVIHFSVASDPVIAKGEYNFIHWTPPVEEIKTFVAELQKRGITKLGGFLMNQQGIMATVDELKKQIKGTNIELVTEQIFNPGEVDFKSLIVKAEQSEVEIYYLAAYSPELEIITRQLKDFGSVVPLTTIETFESTQQLDLFEGFWYVNGAEASSNFINSFQNRFGYNAPYGAPNGYDIFSLIVEGYENIDEDGRPSTEQAVKELNAIKDFHGALGELSINEDGIVISKAVVRMIKNGQPVTVK